MTQPVLEDGKEGHADRRAAHGQPHEFDAALKDVMKKRLRVRARLMCLYSAADLGSTAHFDLNGRV